MGIGFYVPNQLTTNKFWNITHLYTEDCLQRTFFLREDKADGLHLLELQAKETTKGLLWVPDIPLSLLAPKHNHNLRLSGGEPDHPRENWNQGYNPLTNWTKATGLNMEAQKGLTNLWLDRQDT